MSSKTISFVIPAYNEEACVDKLAAALQALFSQLAPRYACEAIIVENGSHDTTYEKLLAIHAADPRFKIIKLARNFGADGGVTAGLRFATGDAAVIMCADLEDPPEIVPHFIDKWEQGYQNVYGVIRRRQGNWLRRLNSKLFYWTINKMTGGMIPRSVSDFRLIDRKLYHSVNQMNERTRMLRGIIAWSGFKSVGVEFDRGDRVGGESKAYTRTVLSLAIRGILSFSYIPLKIATVLGIILSIISFAALGVYTLKFLLYGVPFDGFGTIIFIMLLLFGFLFTILGIISEYIGMIFEETKARPLFIVEDTHGIT